ncbi:hypothetical protein L6B47_00630 [Staphylococcus aureus]|nr:hypothetical protein [Staphylococcus aureus]
MRNKCI